MNKPAIWTALALLIVCVASIAYAAAVTCAERDPPAEVKIVHEYTEGYFNGYDPFRFPQVFDEITKEDIQNFLRENITEERCVLSEIVPR